MGAAASVIIAPITGAIGYGLTYIKDRHVEEQTLAVNVKKVIEVVETRKTARIFAAIFTAGLTEFMTHKNTFAKYYFKNEYIGSNETEAAGALINKGNECYEKKDYESAATFFARASDITKNNDSIKEKLNRTREKIREETEKQQSDEAARREQEQAMRTEREEAAKRKQEAERQAREEALRSERAKTQSKSLLKEATNIYEQAEAMSSLEMKLENYEMALYKCEESCASDATEEAFKTLNKIFESCLKYDAHDEAEGVVQIVRKYFPSKADHFQDILVNQQNETWSPDYESRARRQQNRTIMIMLA